MKKGIPQAAHAPHRGIGAGENRKAWPKPKQGMPPHEPSPRAAGSQGRGGSCAGARAKKKAGGYLLSRESSIIGARGLDFRVRYGNGYDTSAVATGKQCRVMGQRAASEPPENRRAGRGAPREEGRGKDAGGTTIWPSLTAY